MKHLLFMVASRRCLARRHFCAGRPGACDSSIGFWPMRQWSPVRPWPRQWVSLLALTAASVLFRVGITAAVSSSPSNPTTETRLHCPAKFITALAVGPHGGLWVSDEDTGIYHRNAGATDWQSYNTDNSPGLVSNHIYSLCVDEKDRLWAGTLRRGVCVYNGSQWQHYGVITGPLGSHVVAIASNPRDGSVWMCSEAGLSIYECGGTATKRVADNRNTYRPGRSVPLTAAQRAKLPLNVQMQLIGQSQQTGGTANRGAAAYKPHTWHYITRMNGLPANPDCIAFNKKGTAFVGTLCGGLAIAHYPYTSWRIIKGPWHMPRTAYGNGLPSNLINCVAVGPAGTLYVGTDLGLAISRNNGESFRYERGRDYAAKIMGLWHPPIGYRPPPKAFLNKLLPGDHITCAAPIGDGQVWLGTWRDGYAMLNTHTGQIFQSRLTPGLRSLDGYVSALAMSPEGNLIVGRYGSGAAILKLPHPKLNAAGLVAKRRARQPLNQPFHPQMVLHLRPIEPLSVDPLPQPAKPPSKVELATLGRRLTTLALPQTPSVYAGADWATQGDEINHYGRQCGILCASGGIADNDLTMSRGIDVQPMQGPHAAPGDGLRRWIQWLRMNNLNSLYAPWQGSRIQSSWDDHGEVHPQTFDGPDIAIAVALPPTIAIYRLSLYFFNKDGHVGGNRHRDFLIQIYPLARRFRRYVIARPHGFPSFPSNRVGEEWMTLADRTKPLTQARVIHFCGGVYERFILRSPGCYMVCIRRNYSLNTILSGFFLDLLTAKPPLHPSDSPCAWLAGVTYQPPNAPFLSSVDGAFAAAEDLWRTARVTLWCPWSARLAELLAYRTAWDKGAPAPLLARWRWRLDVWTPADRQYFNDAMAAGYAKFKDQLARQAALFRAMAEARKNGSRHFVWRGSWANPTTQP